METAILFVLLSVFNSVSSLDLNKVRDEYERASKDELVAKKLYAMVDEQSSTSTTMLGYKGAVTMMMAKFQFNPISKLDYFKKGKADLEKAILEDADNIELIFLRFSVQSYAPSFLNYNKNLSQDKYLLLTKVKDLNDKDLQLRIARFLKTSPNVSKAERNTLHL